MELLKLVQEENLVERYKPYMANKSENILNLKTAPQLDLGELPSTYRRDEGEHSQRFLIPASRLPNKLVF